ncbi:response regulator transcription factor [Nocardioides sp.]|uniref:response regulator transcription factor n=1 Tax=Nocardioides sp. TaxID=35761 RepID=UPI0035121BD8
MTQERRRALVIDDDSEIADLLTITLGRAGFDVDTASSGDAALEHVRVQPVDLITLDLSLPDMDGTEVCQRLREFSDAYIVMITGRSDEADRLVGLDAGADDYLVKPFSPREVRARVAALLRRPRERSAPAAEVIDVGGGLVIVPAARLALLEGSPLPLTGSEWDVLALLARTPGSPWARAALVESVWRGEFIESDYLADLTVASLKRKLRQADGGRSWIATVGGSSYQLTPPA